MRKRQPVGKRATNKPIPLRLQSQPWPSANCLAQFLQATSVLANVSGVARAWHLIKTEKKYIVTPCISFENEYTNDQNEKIIRFLDVPTFEKYYKVK